VADLKDALAEAMPEGPWLYPADEVSDATDRMIAAELTREQIYEQLRQELPYASAVETESWEDKPDGSTRSTSRSWSSATARRPSSSARAARA
jgi:GTPase